MKWEGHVECMGEMRNAENLKEDHLGDLSVSGKVI
jgi:hypothetical protein